MGNFNYILINGYGWSGSSALVDFMREFKGVYVPSKEFRLLKDPHGVHDLDVAITQSTDALNEDRAFTEFIRFIKKYSRTGGGFHPLGLSYKQEFGVNIEKISLDYVEALTDYKYSGYWWYLEYDASDLRFLLNKVLRRANIYNNQKHTKMRLTIKDEKEFIDITRQYIDRIFKDYVDNKVTSHIVLDQAIPANHPYWGSRYFDNCRILVVDRDPRDVYIDLINEKSLVGYDVAVNHDVNLFINWFKKVRKQDIKQADYKRIQFEKLILDYDNTVREIYEYCNIDPSAHINKKKNLIPERSAKNIGMWKNYKYQNEINLIEKELSEYIVKL